jgi:hypothetical protein
MTTNPGSSARQRDAAWRPSAFAWKSKISVARGRPSAPGRGSPSPSPWARAWTSPARGRVLLQHLLHEVGHPGEGRVGLDAAPRPPAAAGQRPHPKEVKGGGHVRRLHARERLAVERQPVGVDVGAAEAGARGQHEDRGLLARAHELGLGDAAELAVVADDEGDGAAGRGRERPAVVLMEIPAVKAGREVGRPPEDAVALVGAGDCEADSAHLVPVSLFSARKPTTPWTQPLIDGLGPRLGVCRALQELH